MTYVAPTARIRRTAMAVSGRSGRHRFTLAREHQNADLACRRHALRCNPPRLLRIARADRRDESFMLLNRARGTSGMLKCRARKATDEMMNVLEELGKHR